MNLKKIYDSVCDLMPDFVFEITCDEPEKIAFDASVWTDCYDDNVYVTISVFDDGEVNIYFTLDGISRTMEVYELINKLNSTAGKLRAYIENVNGNDYLECRYSFLMFKNKSEEEVLSQIRFAFVDFISDSIVKLLLPLTQITH